MRHHKMIKTVLHNISCILVAIIVSLSDMAVAATTHCYQFDVIVFSHVTPQALSSEQWPWVPESIESASDAPSLPGEDTLMPEPSALTAASRRLKANHIPILLNDSWIVDFDHQRTIHHLITTPASADDHTEAGSAMPATDAASVSGSIDTTSGKYFLVELNLHFKVPLTGPLSQYEGANVVDQVADFVMAQQRRMKSRELNFFEHPLFGVLLIATPLPSLDNTPSKVPTLPNALPSESHHRTIKSHP